MHVFLQAFANILSQKYLGFASFRKYDLAGFRKLSRKFANMVLQRFAIFHKWFAIYCFASFSNLSQMDFRKDLQVRKSWFFARIRNGHFADETLPCIITIWNLGTPEFIYEFMKHMTSYMKKFIGYMNSCMNSYIWIHIHMNSYMKWLSEFIVYMNSYMNWSYEIMSVCIHVYEFICIDSEFIYEFIDIWILVWIHMYGLWIHISEFSNMNS